MSEDSSTTETTDESTTTTADASTTSTESTKKIYIGPSLPRKGLAAYRIYSDGLPSHFDDLVSACPEVERLFVKISNFQKAKAQIGVQGTSYNLWYQRVLKYKATGE